MSKLADFLNLYIQRYPKRILTLSILFFVLLLPALANLKLDFGVRIWFRQSDPLIKEFDGFIDKFGSENYIFLGLTHKDTVFSKKVINDIRKITDELWLAPKVIRVDSLTNFTDIQTQNKLLEVKPLIQDEFSSLTKIQIEQLKSYAQDHKLLKGLYLSKDTNSTLFLIRLLKPDADQITYAETIESIKELIKRYPYNFKMVGTAAVVDELKNICLEDMLIILPLLTIVTAILVYFILRSWLSVSLVFSIIILTILSALGVAGLLDIELNNLSSMVPGVLMAIAIADSIHFLSSYQSYDDGSGAEAVFYSLKKNLLGTLLTTLTTSIGFLSLSLSDLVPIQNFGLICSIGSLFAWLFSITIIFPVLIIIHKKNIQKPSSITFYNPTNFCLKNYKIIILSFVILTIGFSYLASLNTVNSNPFNYFSKQLKIYQDNQFFNKSFGGFSSFEILFDSEKADGIFDHDFLSRIDQLHQWMESNMDINYIASMVNYLKEINQADHNNNKEFYKIPFESEKSAQYMLYYTVSLPADLDFKHLISVDQRYTRSSVFWSVQDSNSFIKNTDLIKRKAKELGLIINITGREYLFNHMNDYVVYSYFISIITTILAIALILMFLFKSITLGLISLIPNIIPVIIGSGSMALLGIPIDVGCVLVMSVCFGVSVDDTIHFLIAVQKKRKSSDSLEIKFTEIFNKTGHALISTTVILVISFLVFLTADFVPNYNYGLFSALILIIALFTDFLLLPAILIYLGKKNIGFKL